MLELVSIIVPVYKTEKYLARCINSIKKQDYTELEIIMVDDGSPDKSGELCDEIARLDGRVKVIHKSNGGLSSARNAGIEASTGKYICFIDSDDYIEKDYISTLYSLIDKYNADLAKINYIEVTSDDYSEKGKVGQELTYDGKDVEKAYLQLRVDSACVFMYRKTLIGDIRFPEGKTSEDIPFNFRIFQKAKKFVYQPVNKYYYWHNPESISNGPLDKNMLNYLYFREEVYKYYLNRDDEELLRLAEVLYARAAMGLMARMTIYGISNNMNEDEYRLKFKEIFKLHSKPFFLDKGTELSRKVLAILVFDFFQITKRLSALLVRSKYAGERTEIVS